MWLCLLELEKASLSPSLYLVSTFWVTDDNIWSLECHGALILVVRQVEDQTRTSLTALMAMVKSSTERLVLGDFEKLVQCVGQSSDAKMFAL